MKAIFKGSILRETLEAGKFSMLSMYDNSAIYFDYVYRLELNNSVYKMRLILDVDGLQIIADCDKEHNAVINTTYYRMWYNELKATLSSDVKTECDFFKIFAGVVFASPVKLA